MESLWKAGVATPLAVRAERHHRGPSVSRVKLKQQGASSPVTPSKTRSSKGLPDEAASSLPSVQDLVPIIHNQSEYIQHLEAEVKFCKEELVSMKQRIRVVVVDNEKLQGELKSKMVEETLKDYTLLDATVTEPPPSVPLRPGAPSIHSPGPSEDHHWRKELEQLKVLYQAQTETLEAQVTSLRKELASCRKEGEEVKCRLRHQETAAAASRGAQPTVGGLCLKCAQHEAVLAETHSNMHVQAIDRLTKERDELMAVLCSVRVSQSEAQQREWASYQQVKQAVEMAEEANLEKTRAAVQCEQLGRELSRQRERLEKELAGQQQKLSEAREEARSEARKEKDALAQTVAGLSQRVAELQGQLDKGGREGASLNAQLDEALRKLGAQEQDSSKVCGELRYQLSQAQLRREEAERGLRETSSKTSRQVELAGQEVQRLGQELIGCRQRLEAAQREASQSQAEVLSLMEQLGQARHQLHLTRQEREVWERCRGEDMAAVTLSAQQREQELTLRLQQTEAQHERYAAELDSLLSSQNALIGKLKEECCILGARLEELTETSSGEVEQIALEKQHLEETLEKLRTRSAAMEEQCVQHGRMHQRMKNRLQQLDQHCQSSAQQVLELLARQNQLTQERHVLNEEMQNLRIQLPSANS
ncbi:serologically defined colon cancer antigen 8 homolog isoform X2 [Hypomesus transpacificus]|uniref:serologically defined colon cancer antigen 8 homolog isoform X2 n=1 Tax=Hypomesus transpacificus TaxID=137520 RepID=UPI001F086D1F|nr:serologically defined colon cancer antigen 8 homolog isoform X2 [Hypomesus transpacificus]